MARRVLFVLLILGFACCILPAKKKEKLLPNYVLQAKTVLVVIQPDAREPLAEPDSNMKAQKAVEEALMKWGQFKLVMETQLADLVIMVQRGTKNAVTPTISGGPIDTRPVGVDKTDTQVRIGVQQEQPPDLTQMPPPNSPDGRAHVGMEGGFAEDTLLVFRGGEKYPLDGSPVWRYTGKDGLLPPDVTAVQEFRKIFEESDKAAKKNQQQPSGKKSP
jgi:hypothetical protein